MSLPAYAALFVIHLANSRAPLLAGHVPPDLGYSAQAVPALQLLQVLCLAYLFAVYGWMLLAWKRDALSARDLVPAIVILTAASWALLPANSSDILEYLGFGRLFGLYHLNPYVFTYSEVTDAFSTYITWDDPMPYGLPVLPLFAIAGVLSSVHVLVGLYAMKLLWAAIHGVNAWLVYCLARELTDDAALAVFAFACNPLVLFELVGNGHNDGALILCGLAAVAAVQQRRGALALALAFIGAVVKIAGVFWVVAIVALLVRQRQWRVLAWGSAACAAVASVVLLWPGCFDALTVLNSQWHYSEDSLHTIVINRLVAMWAHVPQAWDYGDVFQMDRLIATPLFVAFVAWRCWRIRDVRSVVRESACIFVVLLLGYAVSVGPWYFTWLLPMAALTDSDRMRRTIFVACTSSIVLYAFPFAVVEPVRVHEGWAALRLAIAFGAPIAFYALEPLLVRTLQMTRGAEALAMAAALPDRP